ncbi:MAG: hypothetical protein SVU32_07345 [Candidatus Nanohaloarchaea archaeon]|nr:hypothetical protein [Candidatus Nanohaloarchaea archaeon]
MSDDPFEDYCEDYGVEGLQVKTFETVFNYRKSNTNDLERLNRRLNSFLEDHEIYEIKVDVDVGERRYKGFKSYTVIYREDDIDG